MTKTLTEQWREGKIKEGYYYTLLNTDSKMIEINYCWDDGCFQDYCDNMIDEVLAPVPSYNDYKKLRKLPLKCFQLEEDNSALVVINKDMCKKVESLQEQLKEANHILKDVFISDAYYKSKKVQYLKKWGVK